MNVVAMFVLGLFFGWLAEWAIDWYYWRVHLSRIANENTGLKERIASLKAKKKPPARSAGRYISWNQPSRRNAPRNPPYEISLKNFNTS
jgi:hypothetical protein